MVSFRPHTFRVLAQVGGGYNSDGEPIAASEVFGDPIPCRVVEGENENVQFLPSGAHIVHQYVIYCDIQEGIEGKTIEINTGKKIDTKVVKTCRLGQLNTKLYL